MRGSAVNAAAVEAAEYSADLNRFPRAPFAAQVRRLSKVSNWRSAVAIGTQWLVMIACLVSVALWPFWWVCVIAGVVVATRMQALGVLLHDGVHYLLFTSRIVNDVVCDLCVAFPIGMSTTLYRRTHFQHHRLTNTEEDQDLVALREDGEWYDWPKSRRACVWVLLKSLLGFNAHRAWILYKHWAPWNHLFDKPSPAFPLRARFLYVGSTVVVYSLIGWGLATAPWVAIRVMLVYAIPGLTLLNLFNRIRATAEHVGTRQSHELDSTRTVVPTLWERLTIAPFGVSYHLEHHLFPSVPGRNLSRLHQCLMRDTTFRARAHITRSYRGFFTELMTPGAEER